MDPLGAFLVVLARVAWAVLTVLVPVGLVLNLALGLALALPQAPRQALRAPLALLWAVQLVPEKPFK